MMVILEQLVEWRVAGETEVHGKETCPSATLSTTNPTLPDPGSNLGRRSGKPTIYHLSDGTAKVTCKFNDNLKIAITFERFSELSPNLV
jgi:hypothetical protein